MGSGWVIPLLAGIVAAVFAARVWGQWSARRRPHQLAWAIGLSFYTVATLVDALVSYNGGWDVLSYRVFFAVAAGNVGFLGLGTMLLARPAWVGRAFAVFVVAAFAVAAIGQLTVPLSTETYVGECVEDAGEPCQRLGESGSDLGAKAIPFSSPARIAFLLLNVVGGLALIGGAILSWWQTRATGVLLIGAGAMLPFLGGSISTLESPAFRVPLQFAGIVVMFFGYLRGRETPPPTPANAPFDG